MGLILHSNSPKSSCPPIDIIAFWTPFLLVHLGRSDAITSYSQQDNTLWQRHFLAFLSQEKNWVPVRGKTGLVIPKQFHGMENHKSISGTAVLLFSNLKGILVGPLPKEKELKRIIERIMLRRSDGEVLRIFEIELSLLYEVLHTKLPLLDSKTGSYFRMANFGCILVALISFSLVKKHYNLDWFAISHIQDGSQLINNCELPDAPIKRRRYCYKNKEEKEVWLSEEEFEKLLEPVMNQKQQELIKNLNWKVGLHTNSPDYMFYLVEMQPTMMAGVLDNWKDEFKRTSKETRSMVPLKFFSNERSFAKKILFASQEVKVKIEEEDDDEEMKLLSEAVEVAGGLEREDGYPWEGMGKVWVQLMCYAAIKCRPNVHADQLSKGGELLTFVGC
ncbi:hypothetical protein SLEP1_g56520 [Rubroshorea leprosula]|uniref:DUF4220 domain-containing protein n=1 Tax=Rubroshorea leprosula TaxID=152421 RepID=A0AAV5MJ04_9ROSI|nr:hypothetical protein SLEP1_g56520 [Rubroshorea leprosula]